MSMYPEFESIATYGGPGAPAPGGWAGEFRARAPRRRRHAPPRRAAARTSGGGPWGQQPPPDRAVAFNRSWADRLGWRRYFARIVQLLGFTSYTPDEPTFAEAVARWQQDQGLTADGILGPATWERIRERLGLTPGPAAAPGPAPSPTPAPPAGAACAPPSGFTVGERTAVALTSRLETGRPFACVVSRTDGISMGMLQWNLLAGTLQNLLAEFESRTGRLREFFGGDYDRLMRLVALRNTEEERREAVRQATDERLAARWGSALQRVCADPAFCALLMRDVRGRLRRASEAARRLGLRTIRGLALVFDVVVGDGLSRAKLERFAARLRRRQAELGRPLGEREALVELADEAASRLTRYRDERRARRMLIANGRGIYRRGPWNLDREFSNLDQSWAP